MIINDKSPISDKFDQFWAVNRRLMEQGSDQEGDFKHIPIRCYNEVSRYKTFTTSVSY